MAVVTVCSDFGAQEKKMSLFPLFPSICYEVMGQGLRGLKKKLTHNRIQKLTETETEMCLNVSCGGRYGSAVDCLRAGILGAADLGMA